MYCTNCGAEIQGNFCNRCGAPAPQAPEDSVYAAVPYEMADAGFTAPMRKKSVFKQWWFWMLLGILAVALVVTLIISALLARLPESPSPQPAPATPPAQLPQEEAAGSVLLADQDGIKVIATGLDTPSEWGFSVLVTIENSTDTEYEIQVDKAAVNHCLVNAYFSCTAKAGETVQDNIYFDYEELGRLGIDEIGQIELSVVAFDWESLEDLFITEMIPLRLESAETLLRPSGNGQMLFSQDGLRISYLEGEVDSYGDGNFYFFIENDTDRTLAVESLALTLNGETYDVFLYAEVLPGYAAGATCTIWDQELSPDAVRGAECSILLEIYDANTYETIWKTDKILFSS